MNCRCRAFPYLTALVLLAVEGSGCGQSSTPDAPLKPITPVVPPVVLKVAEPAKRRVPADVSLTSDEYIRLGLPAPDRTWSGDDMVKAFPVFNSLVQKGYGQLPRFNSERSGEMFTRLTSAQNLELYQNRTLPVAARLPQAANYLGACNQIFKLYLAGFLKNDVGADEIIELMGAQFRSLVATLDLIDEFWPTIDKNDAKYEVRLKGLEQMKQGFAGVAVGALQTLTERQHYPKNDLVKLIGYMDETFPRIVPRLPPGTRTEMLLKLEKMQTDPALKDLQPGLGALLAKLKTAVAE